MDMIGHEMEQERKISERVMEKAKELEVCGMRVDEYIAQQQLPLRVSEKILACDVTTFGLGGEIRWLMEPKSISSLASLLQTFETHVIPWRVLGAGSNVVIGDGGCRDVVVRLGKDFQGVFLLEGEFGPLDNLTSWAEELSPKSLAKCANALQVLVFALAGTSLMGLSRKATELGLSGLEFSAGIPASVGGAVRMNAGAHGASMSDIVEKVLVIDRRSELKILSKVEMDFGYRRTSLEQSSVVLGALLCLSVKPADEIIAERLRCLEYRRSTQPLRLPSAGSVFKNPTELAANGKKAAELLEGVGVKGLSVGGVSYSALHANWLVKIDESATASAVMSLVKLGKERVAEKFGVELEPEIIFWS